MIYTNDLPMSIKSSNTILFADDTTVFCSPNNLAYLDDTLNNDLNILADWFRANKLSPNTTKQLYTIQQAQQDE